MVASVLLASPPATGCRAQSVEACGDNGRELRLLGEMDGLGGERARCTDICEAPSTQTYSTIPFCSFPEPACWTVGMPLISCPHQSTRPP